MFLRTATLSLFELAEERQGIALSFTPNRVRNLVRD